MGTGRRKTPAEGCTLDRPRNEDAFPVCAEETLVLLVDGEASDDAAIEVVRSTHRLGLGCLAYHDVTLSADRLSRFHDAGFRSATQPDADVGGRLEHLFFRAFLNGARRVVAFVGRAEGVTPEILGEAFDALGGGDTAIGPSGDGGYYLIGLSRPCRKVFRGIPWGTDLVLRETMAHLHSCGLRVRILPPLLASAGA
ncbi:MAG: DUF2064 domain-containing protein [Planctomycetes bacterium]|nr:DUF2064 domain-containing protein [Planctomycetota bacterium]